MKDVFRIIGFGSFHDALPIGLQRGASRPPLRCLRLPLGLHLLLHLLKSGDSIDRRCPLLLFFGCQGLRGSQSLLDERLSFRTVEIAKLLWYLRGRGLSSDRFGGRQTRLNINLLSSGVNKKVATLILYEPR